MRGWWLSRNISAACSRMQDRANLKFSISTAIRTTTDTGVTPDGHKAAA